jgi:hypothetical protein
MDRSQVDSLNTTETTDDGRLARGRQRMRELVVESEVERQAVADGLANDLGRTPSTAETLLIETTAAQVVEARKLRRLGKSSEMQDRLVYRGLSKLGIKPAPSKQLSIAEQLAARGYAPPVTQTDKAAPETPDDEPHLTEAPSASSEAVA